MSQPAAQPTPDPRGHRELVHSRDVAPEPVPAAGWDPAATIRVLSRNPQTGAFSGVLRLPKGFRRPAGSYSADTEWLILSGWVWVGRELRSYGYFDWAPAGAPQDALHVLEDTEILLLPRTGPADFTPLPAGAPSPGAEEAAAAGCIRIASEEVPWVRAQTKDAPEYGRSKYLRRDPATGAMSALVWAPPGSSHPRIEFHDTVEEMYLVVGDTSLRNSGRMDPGSYFWRPPYITHGPFSSEQGAILYLYSDAQLVNYFTDDPEQPMAANFRQAEHERAERARKETSNG